MIFCQSKWKRVLALRCSETNCFKLRIIIWFFIVGFCGTNTINCFAKIEVETNESFIPKDKLLSYDDNIEPFSFAVISDPHSSEVIRKGYEKFGTAREKFKLCLDQINKIKEPHSPEFILITGDIHLWAIKDIIKDVKLPIHVVAGNHENKVNKKELRDFFPNDFKRNGKEFDYYSFLHKVRFIGICDAVSADHVGHLSSETIQPFGQSEWLEVELKKEEKIKVIFGHIPPEPNGEDKNMWLSRNDSLFFNDLIKRTKPSMMFFGHQHKPKKLTVSGCDLYIVRSSSWNAHDMQ